MPVLYKYKNRDEYFALTSISGKVITYQLTAEGIKRLQAAGVLPGQQFPRALLLDLYRSGDAFTGSKSGSEGADIEILQLEFDFAGDPEPETLFPRCALCAATNDLHLTEIKNRGHRSSILCPQCRFDRSGYIDGCLPLPLVSRGLLQRFPAMKEITELDDAVTGYKRLLDAEFESRWRAMTAPKPFQGNLWDLDEQKKLF